MKIEYDFIINSMNILFIHKLQGFVKFSKIWFKYNGILFLSISDSVKFSIKYRISWKLFQKKILLLSC